MSLAAHDPLLPLSSTIFILIINNVANKPQRFLPPAEFTLLAALFLL
jgi:hypothetical protein